MVVGWYWMWYTVHVDFVIIFSRTNGVEGSERMCS